MAGDAGGVRGYTVVRATKCGSAPPSPQQGGACRGLGRKRCRCGDAMRQQHGDVGNPCRALQRTVFSRLGNTPSSEAALGRKKKCCWGPWDQRGGWWRSVEDSFCSPAHVQRCQLLAPTAPGSSVALLRGWGLPAAVTGRCAPRLHGAVVGGMGWDRGFGSTGSATVGGWERVLLAAGRCQRSGFASDGEIHILFLA